MISVKVQKILSVILLLCVASLCAIAQDAKNLVGKWSMTSETNGDPVKWVLVIKETDGKLSAALASPDGEQAAKDFSYSEGLIKFKAPYNGDDYDIELKATDDKLQGTWKGNGDSGKTSGSKL